MNRALNHHVNLDHQKFRTIWSSTKSTSNSLREQYPAWIPYRMDTLTPQNQSMLRSRDWADLGHEDRVSLLHVLKFSKEIGMQ